MQSAKDFAQAAAQMGLLATAIKPDDADPYSQARKLIQFHLLSAANQTRAIAEAITEKAKEQSV